MICKTFSRRIKAVITLLLVTSLYCVFITLYMDTCGGFAVSDYDMIIADEDQEYSFDHDYMLLNKVSERILIDIGTSNRSMSKHGHLTNVSRSSKRLMTNILKINSNEAISELSYKTNINEFVTDVTMSRSGSRQTKIVASDHRHYGNRSRSHPKNTSGSTTVLILAYQRTGSTLTGAFFNVNPNIFYIYEPLDATYTAMYGTAPGWNVPSDIYTAPNGDRRILPQRESGAIQRTLKNLWSCDITSFPLSMMIHPFWFRLPRRSRQLGPYVKCASAQGVNVTSLTTCLKSTLNRICGWRLNPNNKQQMGLCRLSLMRSRDSGGTPVSNEIEATSAYYRCIEPYRNTVDKCSHLLTKSCAERSVRIVKTVRASMEIAGHLMKKDPNLKIIHLLRDPLGVALSREEQTWSRGFYDAANSGFYRHAAHSYCQRALVDILERRKLERKFPGRILAVIFDKLARNTEQSVKTMYDFIGVAMPDINELINSIIKEDMLADRLNVTSFSRQLRLAPLKWKRDLINDEIKSVKEKCMRFYEETQIY